MSDLISREALKKALDEQMNFDENCRDSVFDIIDNAPTVNEDMLVEDVIKAHENIGYEKGFRDGYAQCITDKEERPTGEWIPVSERLPEERGYYLVTTDGSHNAVIDIAEYGKFYRKPENEYVLEWNKASRVIAWQPLPEPYKKGGAEND